MNRLSSIPNKLLLVIGFLCLVYFGESLQGQTFTGKVNYCVVDSARLLINADSSVQMVCTSQNYVYYEEFSGTIRSLGNDLYYLGLKARFSKWCSGIPYDHAEKWKRNDTSYFNIEASLKVLLAPVTIEFTNGSKLVYNFKGRIVLDRSLLNKENGKNFYTIHTNKKDLFTNKPLSFREFYNTRPHFNVSDTLGQIVRIRNGSLTTIPLSPVGSFIHILDLKQKDFREQVAAVKIKNGFNIDKRRLKGDSVVWQKEYLYRNDTVPAVTSWVRQYFKGRLLFEGKVEYTSRATDSMSRVFNYDEKGRLKTITRRNVSLFRWDSLSYRPYPDDEGHTPGYNEYDYVPPVTIEYMATAIYTAVTVFSDSLVLVRGSNAVKGKGELHVDSILYYSNGLKKKQATYNGSHAEIKEYSYKFNPDGTLKERMTKIPGFQGSSSAEGLTYKNGDTLPEYYISHHFKDNVKSHTDIIYDAEKKRIGHRTFTNGKLQSFSRITHWPDGTEHEVKTYKADSTLDYQYIYFRRNSPGRQELWNFQSMSGNFYSCRDTVKTRDQTEIRHYSAPYRLAPGSNQSIPLSECKMWYSIVYDNKQRILRIINRDVNTEAPSLIIEYTYSK